MSEHGGIDLYQDALAATLDPVGYLYANDDLAGAAADSADPIAFAEEHFAAFGHREGRLQFETKLLPRLLESRTAKLERLARRSPGTGTRVDTHTFEVCGQSTFALAYRDDARLPVPFERVSSHGYDAGVAAWVDAAPDQLFLDLGSGLQKRYRPNVVFAEIAALPSTDVLCFGDALPFDDDVFDGIVCLAVLEHVPDPLTVAREMVRVLRPGGRMIVDWPFLQPVHGYPHHYFNATEAGARIAFEALPAVAKVDTTIPPWLHPVFALRWMLDEWQGGLPEVERHEFLGLSVQDILASTEAELLERPWASSLPEERQAVICAGTRLVVTKA